MNPLTEGIFAAALCVSAYAIHDIEDAANRQASALQQIANQARDQSRTLDGIREDNREVLEHLAGAAKRGAAK